MAPRQKSPDVDPTRRPPMKEVPGSKFPETELSVRERDHNVGCPEARGLESVPFRRPDGSEGVAVRCRDCGGQTTYETGNQPEPGKAA